MARRHAEQELHGAMDLRQLSENFAAELGTANLPDTPSFPGRRLQALLDHPPGRSIGSQAENMIGGDRDGLGAVSLSFYGLARAAMKMFARLVAIHESLNPVILFCDESGSLFADFVILKEKGGRIDVTIFDPYKDFFLRALEGSELPRHRECEVCKNYFYAVRTNQRACSRRCNSVRRVRNWRKNQATYEQTRKFKSAGVCPQGGKP